VVCDRSVLDNYAYLALACGRQPEIERFLDSWLPTYDLLIKVPVVGRAEADGVRDVDDRFVRAIDALVDRLLDEKGLAHERLDPERRETWPDVARHLARTLWGQAPRIARMSSGEDRSIDSIDTASLTTQSK
jgi:hypothetical protein